MATAQTPALPPSELDPNKYYNINREDCIGDSLVNINANANALAYRIAQLRQPLNTSVIYVNDSAGAAIYNGPGGNVNVTAGGNDSTGNGSTTAPFKTLKKAVEYLYSRDANLNVFILIRLCPGNYVGCTIANTYVSPGAITQHQNWQRGGIAIQGSTGSYITQYQYGTPGLTTQWPFQSWTHMYIDNITNILFDNVTFRYHHAVNPFIPTAGPGTGTLTDYNVIVVDNARVDFLNTTFESIPQVLSTNNPQQMHGRYIFASNFSTVVTRNITINNTTVDNFGPVGSNANARYFILAYNSNIYMFGTCTLQNGPRFSAFVEPARASNFYQESGFSWVGSFGSQLGSGGGDRLFDTNPSSSGRDYLPGQAKNYIVKPDGPHGNSRYVWTSGYPANSYGSAYPLATIATWYSLEQRRPS